MFKFKCIFFTFLASLVINTQVSAERVVELSFWQFLIPEKQMRTILDNFERQNPGVKVKMQQLNWRDGLDKITTSIAGEISSDVCELGSTWVAKFAESGVLYDLSGSDTVNKQTYLPELLKSVKYNNKYYAAPWTAGTRVFYYNKEIFAKAGLDPESPPRTWDELYHCVLKISGTFDKSKRTYPFAIPVGENYTPWQTFLPFIWSNGGSIFDSSGKNVIIDSDENIEALRFYQKLSNYSLLSRQPNIDRNFAMGNVAMMISGGWNLNLIPRLNPQLQFGVSLIPAAKSSVSFLGSETLVIFKNTKHPEEAKALIKYLTSEEVIEGIIKRSSSLLSGKIEADIDETQISNPYRDVFIAQGHSAKTPPPHHKWSQIQEKVSLAIDDALFNKIPADVNLKRLKLSIREIISDNDEVSSTKGFFCISFGKSIFYTISICVIVLLVFSLMHLKKQQRIMFSQTVSFYVLLLPWIVIFLVFYFYPFIYSFLLSFTNYSPLKGYTNFCGLENYISVLTDKEFQRAFLNTFYFALFTCPASLVIALGCAMIIHKKIPIHKFIQMGLFAPISISVIVAATMFSYFYSSEGIFNDFLKFLHLPLPSPENWLMNPKLALPSIMLMNVWSSFGFYMVILTAGLHAIPRELYEASLIDGTTTWQRFRYITLPQLKPFILLIIVLNTIKAFQVFPEIFAMTQGGPNSATTTLVYYLYKTGFTQFDMGRASAVGYILLYIIGLFSCLEIYLLRRKKLNEN